MKLLQGKVAIVTGAARGIGEAIALKLAEQGANIAFTYVSEGSADKAKAVEEKAIALGVKAKAYRSNAGKILMVLSNWCSLARCRSSSLSKNTCQ